MRSIGLGMLVAVAAACGVGDGFLAAAHAQKLQAKKTDSANLSEFIASDFCAAIVVHPGRLIKSPAAEALPLEAAQGMAAGGSGAAKAAAVLDPKKVRRAVILIDPTPIADSPVSVGVILQFEEDINAMALLSQQYQDIRSVEFEGKKYLSSSSAGQGDVPGAAYVAGPRTLLMGPEPTLKKMLAAEDAPRPLLDQLRRSSLKNDLLVEILADPLVKLLQESSASSPEGAPSQGMMAAAMLADVKAASLSLNFSGDTLLQLALYGKQADSVAKLHGQLSMFQAMAGQQLKTAAADAEKTPEGLAGPLVAFGQELLDGTQLTKEDDRALLVVKMPKDLPGMVKKLMETAQGMAVQGLPGGDAEMVEPAPAAEEGESLPPKASKTRAKAGQ